MGLEAILEMGADVQGVHLPGPPNQVPSNLGSGRTRGSWTRSTGWGRKNPEAQSPPPPAVKGAPGGPFEEQHSTSPGGMALSRCRGDQIQRPGACGTCTGGPVPPPSPTATCTGIHAAGGLEWTPSPLPCRGKGWEVRQRPGQGLPGSGGGQGVWGQPWDGGTGRCQRVKPGRLKTHFEHVAERSGCFLYFGMRSAPTPRGPGRAV